MISKYQIKVGRTYTFALMPDGDYESLTGEVVEVNEDFYVVKDPDNDQEYMIFKNKVVIIYPPEDSEDEEESDETEEETEEEEEPRRIETNKQPKPKTTRWF